jgi:uncharacterized protein YggL (DUF469 family)
VKVSLLFPGVFLYEGCIRVQHVLQLICLQMVYKCGEAQQRHSHILVLPSVKYALCLITTPSDYFLRE